MNKRILVISDTHCPYHHPDLIQFLKAIKTKYKPDRVIHIGDEVDSHAISFHDSDPDLYSAGQEREESLKTIHAMEKLFPVVDLMDSNHGSLVYRRQKATGLPRAAMKTYCVRINLITYMYYTIRFILSLNSLKKLY